MTLSPDYPLEIFFQDLNEYMLYTAPFILCVLLWKKFVTNRLTSPGAVTVLGLDASASKNLVNLVNPVDVDRPFFDRITELTRPG
jgi:hypothetical protein